MRALKARKMKMGAPILHTLTHPAHSLRPLLSTHALETSKSDAIGSHDKGFGEFYEITVMSAASYWLASSYCIVIPFRRFGPCRQS